MKTFTALVCGAMVVGSLSFVACGGHVAVDGGGDDSGVTPDSGIDSGVDIGPPDGPCTPGTSWTVGCNTCSCTADRSIICSEYPCPPDGGTCPVAQPTEGSPCSGDLSCDYKSTCGAATMQCLGGAWRMVAGYDAGCGSCPPSIPVSGVPCLGEGTRCAYSTCPDGSSNVDAFCKGGVWNVDTGPCAAPECPPSEPSIGSACSGTIGKCRYSNGCGGSDYLYCDGARWQSAGSDCPPPPTCPTYEPSIGSPCSAPLKCSYPNSCGGFDEVYCPGAGAPWSLAGSTCTTPSCPPSEPPAGSACPSPGGVKCEYKNACGGSDYLDCAPWGTWRVDSATCTGGPCPPIAPPSGSSCAGYPGGTTCSYPPGGYCPQPCVCGADGLWTCYDVVCDAGPPPPPPPSGCTDGVPCSPGSGCGETCVRSCSCGGDGVFHCTPSPCVDAGGV